MSSRPVCIAQISDLHIKPPGVLAYGRVDTAKALERCVAALNEFDPAPDFVVISGDLADTPTADEYQHLKQLLAPLKLPFAGIPGNHDARRIDARGVSFRGLCLSQRERSIRKLRLASSISSCSIPACRASRTARSMQPRCNGSSKPWLLRRSARAIVPAPSAVRGRHLAYGPAEFAQCRSTRIDRQTSSARAPYRRRPCSSSGVDDIRGHSGHDLPGAEPCRGSRSCRIARAVIQGRAASFPPSRLVSGRGVRQVSSRIRSRSGRFDGPHPFFGPDGSSCKAAASDRRLTTTP